MRSADQFPLSLAKLPLALGWSVGWVWGLFSRCRWVLVCVVRGWGDGDGYKGGIGSALSVSILLQSV